MRAQPRGAPCTLHRLEELRQIHSSEQVPERKAQQQTSDSLSRKAPAGLSLKITFTMAFLSVLTTNMGSSCWLTPQREMHSSNKSITPHRLPGTRLFQLPHLAPSDCSAIWELLADTAQRFANRALMRLFSASFVLIT